MEYVSHELDRATGELVTSSLGDWRTVTEVGARHGAGPKRTRQVLVHMGFLVPEGRRYRLPFAHVERGLGKRIGNPKTGRPFDVVSPEGQRLVAAGWPDAVADLEADERGEPDIAVASAALDVFAAQRREALDTEGRVRWLVDHFPGLDVRQVAHIVCISRQLVERIVKKRADQLREGAARKATTRPDNPARGAEGLSMAA